MSLIFILATSGLFVILYMESIKSFDALKSIDHQLLVTNKLSYQSSLVLSSFYFTISFLEDSNMMIREQSPMSQLQYNLDKFGNVNRELLKVLYEEEGSPEVSTTIEDFLQTYACQHLSRSLASSCESATQGNELGLLGLNLKYHSTSSHYVDNFKSNPSWNNRKTLSSSYFEKVIDDTPVLDAAYNFLLIIY